MKLTRRSALIGAGAAVCTGGATVLVAFKTSGIKTALAGAPDAQILALAEQHDRTFAEMNEADHRCGDALWKKMPAGLRYVDPFDFSNRSRATEVWKAIAKAGEYPECEALRVVANSLKERCHELAGWMSQIKAMTLQGMSTKLRIAMLPGHRYDCDMVHSVAADLERLAGEARS